jgi:hypothetical protein
MNPALTLLKHLSITHFFLNVLSVNGTVTDDFEQKSGKILERVMPYELAL